MNYFTLWVELDNAADESTWRFGSYMGDARGRLMNKLVGKGGQTTMLFDVSRCYPQAYVHQHKMHVQPVGFTAKGMFEINNLIDQVEKLVFGNAPDEELDVSIPPPLGYGDPMIYRRRCIYSHPLHITCNNHFLGDNVLDYAGQEGFRITQTCLWDPFPEGLKEYLHHKQVNARDARTKAMRFKKPIVGVKQVPAGETGGVETKPYSKTLMLFQLTGAMNISGVNNLLLANLYITVKLQGKTPNRCYWNIEQNKARGLILATTMVLTTSTM
jgi:hypothetical protein